MDVEDIRQKAYTAGHERAQQELNAGHLRPSQTWTTREFCEADLERQGMTKGEAWLGSPDYADGYIGHDGWLDPDEVDGETLLFREQYPTTS